MMKKLRIITNNTSLLKFPEVVLKCNTFHYTSFRDDDRVNNCGNLYIIKINFSQVEVKWIHDPWIISVLDRDFVTQSDITPVHALSDHDQVYVLSTR